MALREVVLLNIELLMKARGIANMTELAKLSGVSQSVLSRFKTGTHGSIGLDVIEKLSTALHVPAAQLLQKTTASDPRTAQVLLAMEDLPDWGKDAIVGAAQAIVASAHHRKM